jgi:DNA-binding Xre family transcriptional regulator
MTELAKALAAYQQKYDVEGKELAASIGIEESTLTRIKQGRMPDARGLAKIIAWLTGSK